MKQPKFKIGDQVVVVCQKKGSVTLQYYKRGDVFIVGRVSSDSYRSPLYFPKDFHPVCACFEEELEHYDIYNSPLYKALE